jgi:hypothetical protein
MRIDLRLTKKTPFCDRTSTSNRRQAGETMMTLEELRENHEVIDAIDWNMTPEEAVRLYLEWGNNWARGDGYVITSKSDYTTYFVVNCWSKPYYIYLIRRNSDEAAELAKFEMPTRFERDVCELKGVYALDDDLKAWLKQELGVQA